MNTMHEILQFNIFSLQFLGSWAFLEMAKVVIGKLLVNDINKLSPAEQTSAFESYHNTVCHFAPKALHFVYALMKAR